MQIGHFVRFRHDAATRFGGLLCAEYGMVYSMSEDGRKTSVRWNDGTEGTYWTKFLRRTTGKVGKVVRDPKRPIRDRGRGFVPTPPRATPAPIARRKAEWAADLTEDKKIVIDVPPYVDEKGKVHDKAVFRLVYLTVGASHWAPGQVWHLLYSRHGWKVTYLDGSSRSFKPGRQSDEWLRATFGDFADKLVTMVQPAKKQAA